MYYVNIKTCLHCKHLQEVNKQNHQVPLELVIVSCHYASWLEALNTCSYGQLVPLQRDKRTFSWEHHYLRSMFPKTLPHCWPFLCCPLTLSFRWHSAVLKKNLKISKCYTWICNLFMVIHALQALCTLPLVVSLKKNVVNMNKTQGFGAEDLYPCSSPDAKSGSVARSVAAGEQRARYVNRGLPPGDWG